MGIMGWPLASILGLLCTGADGFYLPGVAPTEYEEGQKVELNVNKMTSAKTQLPMRFYDLPFCRPEVRVAKKENLGEVLTGDLIENSAHQVRFMVNKTCDVLCEPKSLSEKERALFKRAIDNEYYVNWIVDNLPAATTYFDSTGGVAYQAGFPIGRQSLGVYYLYNHVSLNLQYHSDPARYTGSRIVGFFVEKRSVRQSKRDEPTEVYGTAITSCDPGQGGAAANWDLDMPQPLIYTYDVTWTESEVRWASRWDIYLKMRSGAQAHWFSLMNSVLVMIMLAAIVALILVRALRKDISRYNEIATEEERAEETGWKLIHGDVFRKPPHARLLAVSVGAGVQLLGMTAACLCFALLGVLSPANRGALLQSMLLFFTFMGVLAGYASSRLCKVWNSEESYKTMTVMMAFLYPGAFFAVFSLLNILIWAKGSSGAVPMSMLFALLVLWFGISVPLVCLGCYYGFRQDAIELPVRTSHVPRQIKKQQWYMRPAVATIASSLMPFGATFTELFFIMTSVWQHQFYYLFGFLALVFVVLMITSAEISIAMTYFQLTAENYHWWWSSFFYSGGCGIYVFLYAIIYYRTALSLSGLVPTLLYFGYMLLASLAVGLMTGSVGLGSTFYFVRTIYGSIKID